MATVTVTGETLAAFNDAKLADPFQEAAEVAEKAEAKAKEIKAEEEAKAKTVEKAEKVEKTEEDEKKPEAEQEEEEAKEEKPKKGKLATRFSELTGKARAAEERAAAAEARLAELEGKKVKETVEKPEPDPKDYSDFNDYTDAVAEWKLAKKLAEKEVAEKKAKEEAHAAEVMKGWNSRIEAAKERYSDFHEMVTSSDLDYEPVVKKVIMESEYGPDILYHLSEDDDDAAKFAKMNVDQKIKFIGRLEGKLEASLEEVEKEEAEKTVKVEKPKPKLPSPITPIKARNVSHDVINDPGEFKGTYAEYKAARMKQRA